MKLKSIGITLSLILSFFILTPTISSDDTIGETFTIISIPDTQEMVRLHPDHFEQLTDWIVDNTDAYNIKFVVHLGDMVNDGDNQPTEWINARKSMDRLFDNGTPVLALAGNHDFDDESTGCPRDLDWWNANFSLALFKNNINNASHCYFGGEIPEGTSNNMYAFFNASGEQFIVFSISFCPNDATMNWLNNTLKQHRDKHAILTFHSHIDADNSYYGKYPSVPNDYDCTYRAAGNCDGEDPNNGQEVYDEIIKFHDNICLVLSGHHDPIEATYGSTGAVNETIDEQYQTGLFDPTVHQFVHDYQTAPNGGDGAINIFTFDLANDTISFKTYSVAVDTWRTDGLNQGEFECKIVHNAEFNSINSQTNGSKIDDPRNTFNWTRDIGATTYHLQVSNSSTFTNPFINLSNITEGGDLESLPGCSYEEKGLYVEFSLPYAYNITYSGRHYYRIRSFKPT